MDAKVLFWALCLLPSAVWATMDEACEGENVQVALLSNLTSTYDPKKRPNNKGPPVEVEVQIFLTSLTDVNQKEQRLGIAGYFREWWTDPRLVYKSIADGGCYDSIHLSDAEVAKVWKPDLYFDNSLKEIYGADLFLIHATGEVFKSQRINHEFECKMTFEKLPYDKQLCRIVIASYSEDANKVRVTPRLGDGGILLPPEAVDKPDATSWDIDEIKSYYEEVDFDGTPWTYVYLEILLGRRPDYYIRGIAFRAMLFVVVSWCSFFVNRNVAPARVAIGTIPVLIMINLMNAVDAFLPPISYSTALTGFLMTCLVFTSVVVFEYALVAYLLQREVWFAEKHAVLMKLGTSYLKKQDGKSTTTADPSGEASAPDEQAMTPGQSRRFFISVSSAPKDDEHKAPSNIFDDHPVITEIFKEFDRNGNGRFSMVEMRRSLRGFGQYRSRREVLEMFRKLGVPEGEDMNLDQFEQFLANPNVYLPVTPTTRSFWDMPPSLQLDITMRWAFPFAFMVSIAVYGSLVV